MTRPLSLQCGAIEHQLLRGLLWRPPPVFCPICLQFYFFVKRNASSIAASRLSGSLRVSQAARRHRPSLMITVSEPGGAGAHAANHHGRAQRPRLPLSPQPKTGSAAAGGGPDSSGIAPTWLDVRWGVYEGWDPSLPSSALLPTDPAQNLRAPNKTACLSP